MATINEIKAAHRVIARAELSDAEAGAIVATGITFAAYVVELSSEFALTTGAAIAVSQVVTGLVPGSARLDILTPEAERQLVWYREQGVMNPSLGPFEALGRGFANEPGMGFAEKYGSLSTEDFINQVYAEVFARLPSPAAMASLKSQIVFFNELYRNEGLENVALQAKGSVLGQIVGYAFFDPSAAAMTKLDDAVASFFATLANGETAGYGKALPVPPPLAFTSARSASTQENAAAGTIVYQAQTNDGGPVKYSLAGTDAALFRLDADTGALRFRASPDYEAPGDRDRDNSYLVEITATDARGNAGTRSVAIDVTDVEAVTRLSVSSSGAEANGASTSSVVSANGRFVIFDSAASNLVAGDTNGVSDIFLHDRDTGTTRRVSVAQDGTEGNAASTLGTISGDGRFAIFVSAASNLVASDPNPYEDIFIVDLATGAVRRITASDSAAGPNSGNQQALSVSHDGGKIAFDSVADALVGFDMNGVSDIFVIDAASGATALASLAPGPLPANDESAYPAVSADGRFVAFDSFATNLVATDTNETGDIFLRDLETNTTALVSVAIGGDSGNNVSWSASISGEGRYVTFDSTASNLVAGDSEGQTDIFLRDVLTQTTIRVSESASGVGGNASSTFPVISADGRYIAYASSASNLVAGDSNGTKDLFVYEVATGATSRVMTNAGAQPGSNLTVNAISADGRFLTFLSEDPTLVGGDTNGLEDVFIVDGLEQGWWIA